MKFRIQKLVLVLLVLSVSVPSAFAQNYPLPGKAGAAEVKCTGCGGVNAFGQDNDGLKTVPYADPIVDHVGRIVDSQEVTDFQSYFRTARAMIVRIAPTQRGTAPPRAYIQIGSGIGVYSLDKLFTQRLPGGTVPIANLVSKVNRGGYDQEQVLPWDAYVYPEKDTRWVTPHADDQDRLFDFDYDDRGYVYLATGLFGWGIVKDNGETSGNILTLVKQDLDSFQQFSVGAGISVALKVGTKYYLIVTGGGGSSNGHVAYDVTNPASPGAPRHHAGKANAISAWAKDEEHSRLAVIDGNGDLSIYDYSDYAAGGSPIQTYSPPPGLAYRHVDVDEDGNFWTAETTLNRPPSGSIRNKLVKVGRSGSGYNRTTYDVLGAGFTPKFDSSKEVVQAHDGYVSVVGAAMVGSVLTTQVRLYKLEDDRPVEVDLNGFFDKYYYMPPKDYARPLGNRVSLNYGLRPIKWNGKTYLIFNTWGMGDVYELQAGDTVIGSRKSGTYGTDNPYAESDQPGPYYGDILSFDVRSSNPSFQYNVTWDFDNPEAGSANNASGKTPQEVTHQFTGLGNSTKISEVKEVKVTATSDSSMTDTIPVTLKVPTARIGVKGTNVVISANSQSVDLVVGDELVDASDGEIEGHYSAWTLGTTQTNKLPNQPVLIDAAGAGTVRLDARYGKYDTAFATTGTPFVSSVTGLSYIARPFVANFKTATTTTTGVTFKGEARKTSLGNVLPTTWTVTWTLKNGATDVVPPQESVVAVGTVPDFPVADRSAIPSGAQLKLTISVLPDLLPEAMRTYAEHAVTQELLTPDPVIDRDGCQNTGEPCTFTVESNANRSLADWTVQWTLKMGSTTKATGTGLTFTPNLTEPGSYTVSVVATTKLFQGTASLPAWSVEGPLCGPVPNDRQLSIFASCGGACAVNSTATVSASAFAGYQFDGCEEFNWNFGDSTPIVKTSEPETSHKYTAGGNKTIRMTVKKDGVSSPEYTFLLAIGGGSGEEPGGDTCTAPSNIKITYSGTLGCKPGTPCKTGEKVTFTALRGSGQLKTCDKTAWTFIHSGATTASKNPTQTYTAVDTYSVQVVVSNTVGTASPAIVNIPVVANDGGGNPGGCEDPPTSRQVFIEYLGKTSGCTAGNNINCQGNEVIEFYPTTFNGYNFQTCDRFEWDFGDQSAKATTKETTHTYAGNVSSYTVSLRVYNTKNTTGTTITQPIRYGVPVKPVPVLAFENFPARGAKNTPVTFRVNSSHSATAWEWTFTDVTGVDRTQASVVATSNSMQHTFTRTGTFTVTVKARNAEAATNEPMGVASGQITIDEVPEYRYLLPVVTHIGGSNGSSWRTDVQIYHPDTTVSPQNPAQATATLRNIERPLQIFASTMIIEDFMRTFTFSDDAGPVIITVRGTHAPQIWTRTYNQTVDGTFGQFIPAIRLDGAGGGSAVGEGMYYLAGLWSDARYRSNIGFVNPTAQAMVATIRVYDDARTPIGQFTRTLQPFQLDQINNLRGLVAGLPTDRPFTLEIDVPTGQWLIAYASFIDSGSNDPVYIQAVRASDLSSTDNREIIIPGIGHTGAWRSDVTIFNPDSSQINVDLEYLDASGAKVGEAKSVPIRQGEFVQYRDIVKQGILGGTVPDGLGMLRVKVLESPIPLARYPMAVARTYNDDGSGKTYGQGISGVASAKANLKPGRPALIPGIRSSTAYYTNIGVTNTTATPSRVIVKMLDPITGAESVLTAIDLAAFQSVVGRLNLGAIERGSLKLEVEGGNVWAFASIIDQGTKDPEYIPAYPLAQ